MVLLSIDCLALVNSWESLSLWSYFILSLSFQIGGTDKFAKVIDFLRRQLHRETLVGIFSWFVACLY